MVADLRRNALGATRWDIGKLILGDVLRRLSAGVAVGIFIALLATGALQGMLYDTGSRDPVTFAATDFALIAIGTLACWIPVRRAMMTDPAVSLREE